MKKLSWNDLDMGDIINIILVAKNARRVCVLHVGNTPPYLNRLSVQALVNSEFPSLVVWIEEGGKPYLPYAIWISKEYIPGITFDNLATFLGYPEECIKYYIKNGNKVFGPVAFQDKMISLDVVFSDGMKNNIIVFRCGDEGVLTEVREKKDLFQSALKANNFIVHRLTGKTVSTVEVNVKTKSSVKYLLDMLIQGSEFGNEKLEEFIDLFRNVSTYEHDHAITYFNFDTANPKHRQSLIRMGQRMIMDKSLDEQSKFKFADDELQYLTSNS